MELKVTEMNVVMHEDVKINKRSFFPLNLV